MKPNKSLFLLDPDIIFLNHGSFGATPRPVFAAYQEWQRRLERQPVLFLGRELPALDRQARGALGVYLNADPNDLVFIPNATHGVNIVARSLANPAGFALRPGDEILTSDHEYGACDYTWSLVCEHSGARYVRLPLPLPASTPQPLAEQFWQGVNSRTRVIYLSHITSPTALRFPVEEICRRARLAGILTVIDGAHAPGQIPVDLQAIGADFYTGDCHKWMMAPKGAGFLYACRDVQSLIEPLVVSWGFRADASTTSGSRFIDYLQWTGTRDPAAALSVPAALHFLETYEWEDVRQRSQSLLSTALNHIYCLTGLPPVYPDGSGGFAQMATARLPEHADLDGWKTRLYDEYRIEVPLIEWNGQKFIRISVQGYNTEDDLACLVKALERLLV